MGRDRVATVLSSCDARLATEKRYFYGANEALKGQDPYTVPKWLNYNTAQILCRTTHKTP